jgi:hypothetical protein
MIISDFYSALFLIIAGFTGLLMLQITSRYSPIQKSPQLAQRLEALRIRFEARRRWSWVMVFFGSLWLLQLVFEQSSAFAKLI